jgi:hypothetical protein
MEAAASTLLIVGLMALVVLVFRSYLRRPSHVSQEDPPGVRTLATFSGDAPELFADDPQGGPLVGVRLFRRLCDGLASDGVKIEARGTIQNAQRAVCMVGVERFALVLEWFDGLWVASVEWVAQSAAEKRHLALTQQVFAPPDSPELRRLLAALDRWLKGQPDLRDVQWHRREKWMAEDTSDPSDAPFV